jgi:hypothetical protein
MNKPKNLCLAPWTHTYLSPQTERRMCCASREPAQNFQQYIDTTSGTGRYIPITLEEHWNGDHMRDVRRRMLAGETLPECDVCNNKLLNSSVYRDYFTNLFGHKWSEVVATTDATGATTMKPVSWDYRFSNLCNFKCRMCGDKLSSSWETELKGMNAVTKEYWEQPDNLWMKPDVKKQITAFQDSVVEQEFAQAVEEHRVEEVYWVGGEPLMYEQHWRYMRRIIELGDGRNVYARYNTNLSRIEYGGWNLYKDILLGLRDWQICASIDGTGATGEYIRTGLDYEQWKRNFEAGVAVQQHSRQMRIDFTLTLPGLTEVVNIVKLAKQYQVSLLTKLCFAFDPSISMSAQILPRKLLNAWVDDIETELGADVHYVADLLNQLRTQPTFEEQWPDTYLAGQRKAKFTVSNLEAYRRDTYTLEHILAQRPEVQAWWKQIKSE